MPPTGGDNGLRRSDAPGVYVHSFWAPYGFFVTFPLKCRCWIVTFGDNIGDAWYDAVLPALEVEKTPDVVAVGGRTSKLVPVLL